MEENDERISAMEINNMKPLDANHKNKINYINQIDDNSFMFIRNEKTKYTMNKKSKLYLFSKYIQCIKLLSKIIITYISLIFINLPTYKKIPKKYFSFKKSIKPNSNPENNNITIALCTMGKEENLFLNEFVDYYLNLGINHMFIYDNNPPNIEKMSNVLENKYKNNVTIYENMSNINNMQSNAFTDCYQKNKNLFDWFLMVDMDEYLYLVEDNSLKDYLSNKNFEKCDFIKFNWAISTDNNLVHYDNRTLFQRFKYPFLKDKFVKTMIRGNIPDLKYWVHSPNISPLKNISCINTGEQIITNKVNIESVKPINLEKAFIIHFRFKSTEELINKFKRGYGNWYGRNTINFLKGNLDDYFDQNKITLEKINYVEKELKFNLWYYRIRYYFCKIFFFNKICYE